MIIHWFFGAALFSGKPMQVRSTKLFSNRMGFSFKSYCHGAGLSFPVPLQADGNVVIVLDAAFMGKSMSGFSP
jgi:hypothetical protein